MELMERVRSFKRNLDENDDPSVPWYRNKKRILLILICMVIAAFAAVVFFLGYLSASKTGESESIPDAQSRVISPLQWEGVCPKVSKDKCPSSFQGQHPVILISLDGFHPSFMDRGFTSTIKNIGKCGTHAPYMFSVFPTKTFPNHLSQVTGLYPAYHGIIDNNMYDPIRKKLFKVGQSEMTDPRWWQREPIWVTAQKQGKRTGCYYWPGSEVEINGMYPTYYKKYDSKKTFGSRVDQILAWLDLPPSTRPNLYTLYVNQPDNALHKYGRNAKEVNDELIKVDGMIERLFAGLQQRKLLNCVDIIIVSDHGHSNINCKDVIDLQKYINVNDTFITAGPFARIRPKGKRNDTLINELISKLHCKNPRMRVYRKEQLPVRYHYADNLRIEPVFVDTDAGWTIVSKDSKPGDHICTGGAHGYDNIFPDMQAMFLAFGPSFKRNFTARPFLNIEIYEMIAELLNIVPNPNNGTRGSMHYMMTSPKTLTSENVPNLPAVAEIPDDEKVSNERFTASGCNCPENEKQKKVSKPEMTKSTHLPFGVPYSDNEISSLNLLYNEEYITAYSLKYKMPLWTAFTLKEQTDFKPVDEICWNGDVRIPEMNAQKCTEFLKAVNDNKYISQRPLYSPGFSTSTSLHGQAMLITNSVMKSLNYSNILENNFGNKLSQWTRLGEVNVVMGPAFDIYGVGVKTDSKEFMQFYERNGPVLIPTHIFAVITWCDIKSSSLNNCDPTKLLAQGFLLPNMPYPNNCEEPEAVINKNVARIVDIEKLTGLSFYKALPIYEAIRLRTMMPENVHIL